MPWRSAYWHPPQLGELLTTTATSPLMRPSRIAAWMALKLDPPPETNTASRFLVGDGAAGSPPQAVSCRGSAADAEHEIILLCTAAAPARRWSRAGGSRRAAWASARSEGDAASHSTMRAVDGIIFRIVLGSGALGRVPLLRRLGFSSWPRKRGGVLALCCLGARYCVAIVGPLRGPLTHAGACALSSLSGEDGCRNADTQLPGSSTGAQGARGEGPCCAR
jgi:hypothetical protein